MGLGNDKINEIMNMKDRSVIIDKTYPMYVLSKSGMKLI